MTTSLSCTEGVALSVAFQPSKSSSSFRGSTATCSQKIITYSKGRGDSEGKVVNACFIGEILMILTLSSVRDHQSPYDLKGLLYLIKTVLIKMVRLLSSEDRISHTVLYAVEKMEQRSPYIVFWSIQYHFIFLFLFLIFICYLGVNSLKNINLHLIPQT